jgi:hypothetical protein
VLAVARRALVDIMRDELNKYKPEETEIVADPLSVLINDVLQELTGHGYIEAATVQQELDDYKEYDASFVQLTVPIGNHLVSLFIVSLLQVCSFLQLFMPLFALFRNRKKKLTWTSALAT